MIIEQIGVKDINGYSAPVIGVSLSVANIPVGKVETFVLDGRDCAAMHERYVAIQNQLLQYDRIPKVKEAALIAEAALLTLHAKDQGAKAQVIKTQPRDISELDLFLLSRVRCVDSEKVEKKVNKLYSTSMSKNTL